MYGTITAADKTIVSASVNAERVLGRWNDSRDIRVIVTIHALRDVDLVKPVEFFATVRLSGRVDGEGFDLGDIDTPYSNGWKYDDDAARVRYFYGDDESVLIHEALVSEARELILDFIWQALWDAERAYESARDKALGL